MLQKADLNTLPNRNGAMRRLTNRLLVLLALALLALGAAAQLALIHVPVPPLVFVATAAICALLLALRNLPLGARRPVVFLVALVLLAALTAGLAYFQFVDQAHPGQRLHHRRVRAEANRGDGRSGDSREMASRADGDRHLARGSGRRHRAAGRRRRDRDPFRVGRRRRSRRAAHQYRRFGRAGRPRQRPCAT